MDKIHTTYFQKIIQTSNYTGFVLKANNKPFIITYYSASDKKTITRNALWTDKCRYWISKSGRMLMTYFDIDADGYRTASDSWSIKL